MSKPNKQYWLKQFEIESTPLRETQTHTPTISSYRAPSTPISTLKQLKGGKIAPEKTLNLRGLTVDQAQDTIQTLLISTHKHTCYLIIHGKGLQSHDQMPQIKHMLLTWLPTQSQVSAFCPATPRDGGKGALYLLVNAKR